MDGTIYLIDWEYSGMNDPMADFAALFIEADFTKENQDYILGKYFNGNIPEHAFKKFYATWFYGIIFGLNGLSLKRLRVSDFGTYGRDRYERDN